VLSADTPPDRARSSYVQTCSMVSIPKPKAKGTEASSVFHLGLPRATAGPMTAPAPAVPSEHWYSP